MILDLKKMNDMITIGKSDLLVILVQYPKTLTTTEGEDVMILVKNGEIEISLMINQ